MQYTTLSHPEMDALIGRVEEAIEADLALSREDLQWVLQALSSFAYMQAELGNNQVTLHKLRKLVGLVSASEKLCDLKQSANPASGSTSSEQTQNTTTTSDPSHATDGADSASSSDASDTTGQNEDPKKKKRKKKPKPPTPARPPEVEHHRFSADSTLHKGALCPECQRGKLHKAEPATFLRITGHAPLSARRHVIEKLRCNACQGYHKAPVSQAVLDDGHPNQRYGYSARAVMALQKFYMGSPYYRQENLQHVLGESVAASTIFDQCEHLANDLQGIFKALSIQAGNADLIALDDTTNRILSQRGGTEKPQRHTGKLQSRTGIYTSGVIAHSEGKKIVLFETNIGHAGEWLDTLLSHRRADRPKVKLMSDALSRNRPKDPSQAILGLCNAHARREFSDVIVHHQSQVLSYLEQYAKIWEHEAKTEKLDAEARQRYHEQHSLPILESLKKWGQDNIDSGEIEANGSLGKAIGYFIKHFEGLSQFCHIPGMPLDNNLMEQVLKLVIRHRKNAMFFKTQAGASIGDVLMSLIATCEKNMVNPYDYFIAVQRHQKPVKAHPEQWLPWNYKEALAQVEGASQVGAEAPVTDAAGTSQSRYAAAA